MLSLLNVNKSYGPKLVLENINMKLEKGTVLGVVGPNGSGKSTILRLFAGVIEADAGLVSMNDQNIFDNAELQKGIVFLADDPYFLLQSTLKDMKSFYQMFYPQFDEDFYYELLKEFPIDENEKIGDFSKGMKRQVTLILAMAARPKVLILDETFDGLDPLMRFKLKQFIIDAITEDDMIVVISSHILSEIETICDKVVLINDKGITFNEEVSTLFNKYTRFQVVFENTPTSKMLNKLNALSIDGDQRIYNIIMKGDRNENQKLIESLEPMIIESTNMDLDEIYRYEMKGAL